MIRIEVYEDDEAREATVKLSFDTNDAHGLEEVAALLEMARCLAPTGTRLTAEVEAHRMYFRTFASELRALNPVALPATGTGEP